METLVLSGIDASKSAYDSLPIRINALKEKKLTPGLAVILVGENPASKVYVKSKSNCFSKLNLFSETFTFTSDISELELINKINELNNDNRFHGILVQLPLPKHINSDLIINTIDPNKDVDGFHPYNQGCLMAGKPVFIPCTPKGVMKIFEFYNIELSGKHVVIIGRSNIVGRPQSILTSLKGRYSNATTTLCHSGTKNLFDFTSNADIVIMAMGSPEFLTSEHVKKGSIIIDVGINRIKSNNQKGYSLVGDANFESMMGKASAITPVPGGVGLMTIAMLVENTIYSAERMNNPL
ncbi:MAG: bifunctional 5,10-methylene-tetrahydrofolate dehydrogenase/5,10-methylene-tetrahydrofolate cyclohydrolase [Candidatus Marinimicrobia bacterium]|nr:bifunctional 5,10-methylene-tetrahydrofolate dehydrogenase/5,10-methylene-tetrahydrofolate cyclohydrolase [Candidatus Neomarinimicrobiota bacterium]